MSSFKYQSTIRIQITNTLSLRLKITSFERIVVRACVRYSNCRPSSWVVWYASCCFTFWCFSWAKKTSIVRKLLLRSTRHAGTPYQFVSRHSKSVFPTNCVSPPGKHFIPLSLSTCLNSFLTIFHPDPCVLPIQISLPDQQVLSLLATFPLRHFLCLHLLLGTLHLHTFALSIPYPPLNAA